MGKVLVPMFKVKSDFNLQHITAWIPREMFNIRLDDECTSCTRVTIDDDIFFDTYDRRIRCKYGDIQSAKSIVFLKLMNHKYKALEITYVAEEEETSDDCTGIDRSTREG